MMANVPAGGDRPQDYSGFEVAGWLDRFSALVDRWPNFWIRLGNFETRLLADDLAGIPIVAPIHVAGLARSGSPHLLDCLADRKSGVSGKSVSVRVELRCRRLIKK